MYIFSYYSKAFTSTPSPSPTHAHSFAQGSDPIWIDNIGCSSEQSETIAECASGTFGVHDCSHSEDVALVCLGGACKKGEFPLRACMCISVHGDLYI